ncbi:hypothetical protein HPB50_023960 [Hyalomma asiaticum]|uniref:Uncharacterized protein n=1 Tax=Hyalomma asiaticum TaxID=266040 RepID=A0ACB7S2I2_HYAAI|nr:hypothetical protein HPB50_023960 [Hyalomma asiaticum]
MCDISATKHCLAKRRSKIGQTVTGKCANAMRVSNSIAAATGRGHIEETLQRATDIVTSHVHAAGLTCSAAKSALLLMRPPDRRRYKTPHPTITVYANSIAVPVVSHLRVLGLILQSNRHNTHTIDKLSLSVQQTARMLARGGLV